MGFIHLIINIAYVIMLKMAYGGRSPTSKEKKTMQFMVGQEVGVLSPNHKKFIARITSFQWNPIAEVFECKVETVFPEKGNNLVITDDVLFDLSILRKEHIRSYERIQD